MPDSVRLALPLLISDPAPLMVAANVLVAPSPLSVWSVSDWPLPSAKLEPLAASMTRYISLRLPERSVEVRLKPETAVRRQWKPQVWEPLSTVEPSVSVPLALRLRMSPINRPAVSSYFNPSRKLKPWVLRMSMSVASTARLANLRWSLFKLPATEVLRLTLPPVWITLPEPLRT